MKKMFYIVPGTQYYLQINRAVKLQKIAQELALTKKQALHQDSNLVPSILSVGPFTKVSH